LSEPLLRSISALRELNTAASGVEGLGEGRMATNPLDSVKEKVEKAEGIVEWLAQLLRGKNHVKKLLLIDVLIFMLFNPIYPDLLRLVTGKTIEWYPFVFWSVIGLIFIAAVVVAVRAKRHETEGLGGDWNERSPIKGLLPFEFADAKLFSGLQREEDFRECLPVLTGADFRFGILCGESGCGKTSYLQAGLWPRLQEQGHPCLYVKFTDLDPLDSIRSALTDQFKLPREIVEGKDFLTLLSDVTQSSSQPTVLLFDQFEQFFVRCKREKQRKPFIQSLAAWYKKKPPLPVKILICLREDFAGRLIEMQKAMGYSLGPQQSFRLEKFEPEKAAKIFRVIAENEGIDFDQGFVDEFTQQELASRDDGLVSPVDIQIFAWMIAAQRTEEKRAFNRQSYQKLGGIVGLSERFLTRALEARETKSRREAAIKVLLALTDGDTSAGVLTLTALREKLVGTILNDEVEEAINWLARGDVRLINPVNDGYEIAHERLIRALRRVADKELSVTDQANKLLDRRVNEWLGNERSSRYLLTWRELRFIEQQKPYLVWERRKAPKEALISQTRRRWHIRIASVSSVLLLASLLATGFLLWRNSEAGQIYQSKSDLLKWSTEISDPDTLSQIARSLAFSEMFQGAFQVTEEIKEPVFKAVALSEIAVAGARLGNTKQSQDLLERALKIEESIEDPVLKTSALSETAVAAAKIGNTGQSQDLLERALKTAESIDDGFSFYAYEKARALSRVAVAAAMMAEASQSQDLLELALQVAESIEVSNSKAVALSSISVAAAKIGNTEQASDILERALQIAESIEELVSKAGALSDIAVVTMKQGDFKLARKIALKNKYNVFKAIALSQVLITRAEMKNPALVEKDEEDDWR
jgi:tetratricopeptide (TPR) repeat protein